MPEHELSEWIELCGSITEDDRIRHTPPPDLHGQILDAVDLTQGEPSATDPSPVELSAAPVVDFAHERQTRAPVALRRHRRHLALASLAAAAVLLIGFAMFTGDEPGATFVAEATNVDLPEAFDGTATATLTIEDASTLSINFAVPLPGTEPVELWLIKPDLSDMVSLGTIAPGQTEWAWPADYPPTEYTLVDLSIEPNDGDPAHSGRSILRGELREV